MQKDRLKALERERQALLSSVGGSTDNPEAQFAKGELTFDSTGNPIVVKKVRPESLPKVVDVIKFKEYFIDEETFK